MNYLEKEDILLINRMTISRHGGNFVPPSNLLNSGSLEYLVEKDNIQIS
jgi:death on curing protein